MDKAARESIWSITPGMRVSYFILFALLTAIGTGLHTWNAFDRLQRDGAVEFTLDIISGISTIGVAAATTAITITEGARYVMVIAQWFEDTYIKPSREKRHRKWREEGIAEGREEGRELGRNELIAEIQAWEHRRNAAAAKGEAFDERPPYADK